MTAGWQLVAGDAETTTPQRESPQQPAGGNLRQVGVVGGVVVVAVGCLVVGLATGRPLLAVGIALAAVAVPVLLYRPRWLLGVLAVSEIANLAGIAESHGVPNFSAALLAFALLALLLRWARHGGGPVWTPVLWFGAAFFATRVVSELAARDLAASTTALTRLVADLLFFLVVFTLCVRLRGELLLARVMVVTAAALSLLELVQQYLLGNATSFFGLSQQATVVDVGLAVGRHSGPLDDPNFWGRVLVTIAPLALSLFADTSTGRRRWWWLGAFVAICGGVYLTGSRGSLLVLGAVLVLWCLLAGRRYRKLLLFSPLAVALLLVLPGVGSRLASITDVSNTSAETADLSLTGRVGVQELGAHMFAEHPAIGVGVANFQTVEPDYQRRYGIEGPILAPHNLYLEMAAESGLLGLAGWLALYGSGLFVAGRARLLSRPRAPTEDPSVGWLLMTGVIVGLLGWGLASIVLHINNFRVFTLLLVIAAGVDLRARRALAGSAGTVGNARTARLWTDLVFQHVPPRANRSPRARSAALAVVMFVALAVASLFVPGVLSTQWSASAGLRVSTVSERQPADAYVVDVSTRGGLVLTYLSLLGNERFQAEAADALRLSPEQRRAVTVTATTGNPPGLLQVTATGQDRAVVRDMAREIAERTTAYLTSLRPFYTLRQLPATAPPTSATTVAPFAVGVVLLVDAAVVAACWLLLSSGWRLDIRLVRTQRRTPLSKRTPE